VVGGRRTPRQPELDGLGSLPKVVTVHAYDHVYRLLRHAIASRSVRPGTRVVEATLATRLQVSRTPVRDALRRLETDGLLVRSANGGLEVTAFSSAELEDIFRVRREFDRLAARLACERGKPQDWVALRSLVAGLGPVLERFGIASYEFSLAHEAVHAAIYGIAFAPAVARMLSDRILSLVELAGELSYSDDGPEEPVVAQHEALVEELASRSVRRALAAADRHCNEAELAAGASIAAAG
jgi:DNA-binding GntR family transcriptional regulator